jgi:hypothetical protein
MLCKVALTVFSLVTSHGILGPGLFESENDG